MNQATVKDCMERMEGETKERIAVVEEFKEEMMKLSDKMSHHSLVCTDTRFMTVFRMEEEEKVMDRRLEQVQRRGENMMGRKTSMVEQLIGWKEMKNNCGQMMGEVEGVCKMARGRVEQLKGDISMVVERRNVISMSTTNI